MQRTATVQTLLREIFGRVPRRHENLDRMTHALGLLGNPHKGLRTVHVTGTNGKGSVSWKISRALKNLGVGVGLFQSPHIATYRERFRFNGEIMNTDDFIRISTVVLDCVKHIEHTQDTLEDTIKNCTTPDNHPSRLYSFFDVSCLTAFVYFSELVPDLDIAVFEVGIGGRLDSTNVIESPDGCVITSIGMDHALYLGNTLESITREKCGIIKPTADSVVVGPTVPTTVVQQYLTENNMSHVNIIPGDNHDYDFDITNTYLSSLVIQEQLLSKAHWTSRLGPKGSVVVPNMVADVPPCRFERVARHEIPPHSWLATTCGPQTLPEITVFDVGHNEQAVKAFFTKLQHVYPNHKYIVCTIISEFKEVEDIVGIMCEHATKLYPLPVNHPRLIPYPKFCASLEAVGRKCGMLDKVCIVPPVSKAGCGVEELQHVMQTIVENEFGGANDAILCVCGSFFLQSAVKKLVGLAHEEDPPV